MASSQEVKRIACRPGNINYQGHYETYHVYGNEPLELYQSVCERDPYSQHQTFLYKRALIGLSLYDPEEIRDMHKEKRKRIKRVHARTQKVLNLWKQELTNQLTNHIFESWFPDNPITKSLVEGSKLDPAFKNTLKFRDLGIGKEQIIEKLLEKGILPGNFRSL